MWLICLAGLAMALAAASGSWWYQGEMQRIQEEIEQGRTPSARGRIDRLVRWGLGGDEIDFWRGACEEASGDVEGALAAWALIPANSPRHAEAAVRRARLALERGRLSLAEEALAQAVLPLRSPAGELREGYRQQLYLLTGRLNELHRSVEGEWGGLRPRAEILRTRWLVDDGTASAIDAVERRLDEASRESPEDDRVWLGRACLALRKEHLDEAGAWLKKCRERRPEDPTVWWASLQWAIASGNVDEATRAMSHVPIESVEPEQVLAMRAWLAARLGAEGEELDALNQLLDRVPGDAKALERLIDRATRAGRDEEAARLRRRKGELDQAAEDYRRLLDAGTPTGQFDRLGRLAETLGRWFEARGWWTLAARDGKLAAEARLALERIERKARSAIPGPSRERVAAVRTESPTVPSGDGRAATRGGEASPRTVSDALADLLAVSKAQPGGPAARNDVPQFGDDARAAGLDFVYDNDPSPLCRLPETMMGGVGLIDYDGDGWLDVYAVQGGPLEASSHAIQRDRLFRNRGDGTFQDVTSSAGLMSFPGGYGHGVAVGDFDNDGRPDLFLTRWRSYALYRNRGDGTFEDVTASAGLAGPRDWPTSAAFADLDGDGDLDLYVCHYVDWDPARSPPCPHPTRPGEKTYCHPRTFPGMPDHVLRNDGGRFVDVTESSGVGAADREGRGLGVVAADLDDDGRVDVYVANDMSANYLFRNQGGFSFRETAVESGVSANAVGGYLAGMGIACGDLDGDGRIDLAVTNYYGESTTFYRNLGEGQFQDRTPAIGLTALSRSLLGFGVAFFDANNDGRLDLATANGHVNDLRPDTPYAMPAQLLLGRENGRLGDVSARAGSPWQVLRHGRGLAAGDLDHDGRLDLLIVGEGEPLAFFHNRGPAGHFVTIQLEGAPGRSNRDAVGARVTVTTAGRRWVAQRYGGGSFLSASDPRLHFGVGESKRIDSIEVRWPSGAVDRYTDLSADAAYLLREGQPRAGPLRGWREPGVP